MRLKQIAKIAKALSDETRLRVYETIANADEVNCSDICSTQSVGGPSVSHHLHVLSDAGLVDSRRQGQFIYYRAIPKTLDEFNRRLAQFAVKDK